jgi:nucleoside-diphosphate-sugar epimerase
VTALSGDRLAEGGLAALATGEWDAVVDTWSARAEAVRRTAALLKGRAGWYGYVSSRSVHADGTGPMATEDAPLVDPADEGYAGDKLRGELATAEFGGPALSGRAGLILGPYEDVGRLPWWLTRLARGGPTLAPGPKDLPLQYVDARDLANFLLDAAPQRLTGPYNLVSPPGHTTMGELLETAAEVTGGRAELRWTDPAVIAAAGIQAWIELPVWLPPGTADYDLLHCGDTSKAQAAGLVCRPVRETVADTWAWLQSVPAGDSSWRHVRSAKGLDPVVEAKVLAD